MRQRSTFLVSVLCFGFAFFYIPIISMIIFSFNKSRLATVWGGFSIEWYFKLFKNAQIIKAATLSLEIAVISATFATILGTMAGMALARFSRFRGRTLFSGLVSAPLIMPEVITGVSLLLLFVFMERYIGWPEKRGFTTVTIAHTTFALSYVAVIIQSRLQSMDVSLEEAAMDLGSKPWQVLFDVTLPIIAPAMISGWLLAFTISLDDVVITNFTTGPGATTLPILIWGKVKLGVTPDINALATLIVLVVSIGVGLAGYIMYRSEKKRDRDIQMAKNAVVVLNRLCYASGNSEWGSANPTKATAIRRVDNYGAGFLRTGARAVFAEAINSISPHIRSLFTTNRTMDSIFMSSPSASGARDFLVTSTRTYWARAHMDPPQAGKYWRSVVGSLTLTASQWRAGG